MTRSFYPQHDPLSSLDHLPGELKAYPQWVAYRLEPDPNKPNKPRKVPYNARTGRRASTTNPATWSDFETAQAALTTSSGYTGLGFVFSAEDRFVGIDLDHCVDPETGHFLDVVVHVDKTTGEAQTVPAAELVAWLASYTEVSISGTGLHVIVQGAIPKAFKRYGCSIEVYDHARFFALVGAAEPSPVVDRAGKLAKLYGRLSELHRPPQAPPHLPADRPRLEDADLINRMCHAKNGHAVGRLWSGDYSAYCHPRTGEPDHSAGDMALCNHLAYWTASDPNRMDELFRQSGLMRPKWDELRGEETYGSRTVQRALGGGL